jgi:hypothetical protein
MFVDEQFARRLIDKEGRRPPPKTPDGNPPVLAGRTPTTCETIKSETPIAVIWNTIAALGLKLAGKRCG